MKTARAATIVRYIGNDPKMAGMEGEVLCGGGPTFDKDPLAIHTVRWKHTFGDTREREWSLRRLPRGYSKAFR